MNTRGKKLGVPLKKIKSELKSKNIHLYVAPLDVSWCDADGMCGRFSSYDVDSEYLNMYHRGWDETKHFIVGVSVHMSEGSNPMVLDEPSNECRASKMSIQDKKEIFKAFDKHLKGHLSWSGSTSGSIKLYYSKQSKSKLA